MLEEDVADDAAAQRGDKCEAEDAEDVVLIFGMTAGVERSSNGSDGDSGEVEEGDEEFEMDVGMQRRAPVLTGYRAGASGLKLFNPKALRVRQKDVPGLPLLSSRAVGRVTEALGHGSASVAHE
jgi:hypothetical protein